MSEIFSRLNLAHLLVYSAERFLFHLLEAHSRDGGKNPRILPFNSLSYTPPSAPKSALDYNFSPEVVFWKLVAFVFSKLTQTSRGTAFFGTSRSRGVFSLISRAIQTHSVELSLPPTTNHHPELTILTDMNNHSQPRPTQLQQTEDRRQNVLPSISCKIRV